LFRAKIKTFPWQVVRPARRAGEIWPPPPPPPRKYIGGRDKKKQGGKCVRERRLGVARSRGKTRGTKVPRPRAAPRQTRDPWKAFRPSAAAPRFFKPDFLPRPRRGGEVFTRPPQNGPEPAPGVPGTRPPPPSPAKAARAPPLPGQKTKRQ